MQGWNSQRLNGNGEVNDDPAFKVRQNLVSFNSTPLLLLLSSEPHTIF